jgi:hypothetical protein
MGVFRTIVFVVIATWLGCSSAFAEKRVALVVGNSAYKNAPRLANPVNDVTMVAAMLKNAGFDLVTTKLDVNIVEMRKALREFGAQARNADVAVIFYAGHGIELDGNNYLIPTDAALDTDTDVFDETFPLDRVLFAVEPAKQLRLIILDACRDNPFAKTMKRTIAARAVGRGLAKVEPNSPNTMIAFAAKAGSTASDGDSKNSPFAVALVEHLPKPGLDLRKAFGFVRDDVLKNTGYKQEPYVYGSLGGDDVPLVPAKPAVAGPQPNPQDAIRRDYELALHLGTRDGWNAFLAQYPSGFYASLAKGELNKVAAEEARATAAEKARLAEEEKARLASEGAKKAEQEKAAVEARAAEEARLAAEKAKQIAQAKAEAAELARNAAEKAVAEKVAAEKAEAEKKAAKKAAAEKVAADLAAKQAAQAAVEREKQEPQQLASLPPPSDATAPLNLAKSVQLELRRVGCLKAAVGGEWNGASQRSLSLFNQYAGTKFDVQIPSIDALDAVKGKTDRVCPVLCGPGYRANGDHCVKITCRSGYALGEDNTCQKNDQKNIANRAKDRPTIQAAPTLGSPTAMARADTAYKNGSYRQCMGARSGCLERTLANPPRGVDPKSALETARSWCSRRPAC